MTINLRSQQLALLSSVFALLTLGVIAGEAGASAPRTASSPQAVSGLQAAQSERSIVVSWNAPAGARKSAAKRFRVVVANATRATAPLLRSMRTTRRFVAVGGLSAGSYRVSVAVVAGMKTSRAVSTVVTIPASGADVGSLSVSSPAPTSDPGLPSPPTGFAAIPGPGTITLVWQAASDTEGAPGGTPVHAFQLRARAAGSSSWFAPTAVTADTSTRELTISGTSAWEFQIRAVGDKGAGAWSAIASAAPGPLT